LTDFVAEAGDDNSGAAARTRLLMRWSAICSTGQARPDHDAIRLDRIMISFLV